MGYNIDQTGCNFFLAAENKQAVLEEIRTKLPNVSVEYLTVDRGGRRYVTPANCLTFEQAAENLFNFKCSVDEHGNIIYLTFESDRSGWEDEFFHTIAPFVREGSWVSFVGQEGEHYRYYFHNGECIEQEAGIVWPTVE